MPTLDCETTESTYESLSKIIGVDKDYIQESLLEFDIDHYFHLNPRSNLCSEDLLLSVITPSTHFVAYDSTCWFHLTRTLSTEIATSFDQGIFPLGLQIDSIWIFLFSLLEGDFPKAKWDKFRQSVETNFNHRFADIYRLKTSKQYLWGPYAILIRDIAFNPQKYDNHDYLGIPEIIDDIFACFEQYSGINLRTIYEQKTRPCIIKFVDDGTNLDYLKSAIKYLYLLNHKTRLVALETYSFDGRGQHITSDKILKIQFV